MKKSLLVLDCDGLLRLFSWTLIYSAYEQMCAPYGVYLSEIIPSVHKFKQWADNDWRKNLRRLGLTDERDYPAILEAFHRFYDPSAVMFDWVPDITGELSGRFNLAVLSNSHSESVTESLNGAAQHISLIVGCNNVNGYLKPHPGGLLSIMDHFGARPEETTIVGDHFTDVETGKNVVYIAGRNIAPVTSINAWGMTETKEELFQAGADIILRHPEDLLKLI